MNNRYIPDYSFGDDSRKARPLSSSSSSSSFADNSDGGAPAPRMMGQFGALARSNNKPDSSIRRPNNKPDSSIRRPVDRKSTPSRLAEHPYLQHTYPIPTAADSSHASSSNNSGNQERFARAARGDSFERDGRYYAEQLVHDYSANTYSPLQDDRKMASRSEHVRKTTPTFRPEADVEFMNSRSEHVRSRDSPANRLEERFYPSISDLPPDIADLKVKSQSSHARTNANVPPPDDAVDFSRTRREKVHSPGLDSPSNRLERVPRSTQRFSPINYYPTGDDQQTDAALVSDQVHTRTSSGAYPKDDDIWSYSAHLDSPSNQLERTPRRPSPIASQVDSSSLSPHRLSPVPDYPTSKPPSNSDWKRKSRSEHVRKNIAGKVRPDSETTRNSRSEHSRFRALDSPSNKLERPTEQQRVRSDAAGGRIQPMMQISDLTFDVQSTYAVSSYGGGDDHHHGDIQFSPEVAAAGVRATHTDNDTVDSAQTSGEHPCERRTYPRRANASNDRQQNRDNNDNLQQNRSNHSRSHPNYPPVLVDQQFESSSFSSDEDADPREAVVPNEPTMHLARSRHFEPQRLPNTKIFAPSEISSLTTGHISDFTPELIESNPRRPGEHLLNDLQGGVNPWAFSPVVPLQEEEEEDEEDESSDTQDTSSHATGRCPPLNLEWLLELSDRRKGDAARRRGSLLRTVANGPTHRSVLEENAIVEGLMKQGFTGGLARTLIHNTDLFSVRIWLVNNSGSMNSNDGHLVVQASKPPFRFENASCTRWEEVQSCAMWHAELSSILEAPMAVRFLHDPGVTVGPQQLGVAASSSRDVQEEMTRLRRVFSQSHPSGTTEINVHLRDICESVVRMAPRLRQRREMVALVIVTDSLPTDENGLEREYVNDEFIRIVQMLRGLPVWIVIRLSTDEKRVVEFYNDLDEKMLQFGGTELDSGAIATTGQSINLDVLDDFVSEAQEVYQHNPWLNYALPLHLCRESGVSFPAFDALDNRGLLPSELADFVQLLFDRRCNFNPAMDYRNFRAEVEDMVMAERGLFNPIKKKFLPWIDMKELDRRYGSPGKNESSCNCTIQ